MIMGGRKPDVSSMGVSSNLSRIVMMVETTRMMMKECRNQPNQTSHLSKPMRRISSCDWGRGRGLGGGRKEEEGLGDGRNEGEGLGRGREEGKRLGDGRKEGEGLGGRLEGEGLREQGLGDGRKEGEGLGEGRIRRRK